MENSIIRATTIAARLEAQTNRIADWAAKHNRTQPIKLVAVAKTKPAEAIREAYQAGQQDFGENYLQEAQAKMTALQDLPLVWHFIGRVQSNKTRLLAEAFDWVQTVASLKIARRLNDQRPSDRPPLNICVQVNIDDEEAKAGCSPAEALDLCLAIQDFPQLSLRGLMAIPAYTEDPQQQYQPLVRLAELFQQIKRKLNSAEWDTLSMGMSNDLEAAIQAGSTMVRLGTGIFGPRDPPTQTLNNE